MKVNILIAILPLLICSYITNAQQPTASSKSPDNERRQKALELLESLATQVTSLQSPENRARIGANIAESLWKDDENRARAMFIGIEDDIKLGFQDRDVSEPADGRTVLVFHKLRSDTVQRIAKYDPEFALNFLHATAPPEEVRGIIAVDAERNLELQLAKQLTISNPDIALKLGRQSLAAHGFSNDLLIVLRQLHRKHRDKGVAFYKEVVQKLRDADLADNYEALAFASSLAEAITPPAADESAFRELINELITSALANDCDKKPKTDDEENAFCFEMASLIPTMEKIDPVRTRKLKHLNAYRENWDATEQAYNELGEVATDGTVDEILALANKYPQIETVIYSQAMLNAVSAGDIERAKTIANSHSNPEERPMLLAQLESMTAQAEATEQDVAEFQKSLDSVPNDRARLTLLYEMTDRLGTKNRTVALKLIDQASAIVDRIKYPAEKTSARLNLAMYYCTQGSDRGLEIAESEIPKLNELIEAATKLDGFDTQYLRDGEWNMSANGSIGSILTSLAQNAGFFAACDLDRAISLAGQFERGEIRMMAQTKLAQSILSGPPTRSRSPSRRYLGFSISH